MRSTSQTSTPTPRIMSARAAGVARRGVARRRLQLREGLPPLGEEVALVDGVVDEVPGKERVETPAAVDIAIRIDAVRAATERLQRRPPRVGTRVEPGEDRRDAPVAAREERLQIRLARALGLDDDAGDRAERTAEMAELPAERRNVLHRLPLERGPRLRHE